MRGFPLIGLLLFNMVAGALAVTPNLGLSSELADALHFGVAAVDTVAFGLLFGRPLAVAAVMAAGCGFVELLQSGIPGRQASLGDVALDLAGILLGVALCQAVMLFRGFRTARSFA